MEDKIKIQKIKLGLSIGVLGIVSTITAYLITLLVSKINIVTEQNKFVITYLINAISIYVIGYGSIKLLLKNTENVEKKEKKKLKISNFLSLIAILIGSAQIVNIITQIILTIIKSIFSIHINNNVAELMETSDSISLILFAVILGPLFEELIFRGTLLKKLRVFGDKTAIIYTAIAFGLFHCNIAQIPFAITAGLILAYTVVKTNNIVYSIILHMILNGLSVALTILLKGNQYIIIMLIMLLIFACIILTLIFVSIKLSNKEVKIENESKYEKKNLYKNIGYIFSVISIVILTIVLAIDI